MKPEEIVVQIKSTHPHITGTDLHLLYACLPYIEKQIPHQLTLDELRQMDGQPVWNGKRKEWNLVCNRGFGLYLKNSKGSVFRAVDMEPVYVLPPER